MSDTVTIPQAIYEQMVQHVQAAYPLEACGLLGGRKGCVKRHFVVDNVLGSATAYEMEPQQQVQALLAMEKEGCELVAIYHSHPDGPAAPSATDVEQAYYPEAAQIIVSLANPEAPVTRVFSIVDGEVDEMLMFIV